MFGTTLACLPLLLSLFQEPAPESSAAPSQTGEAVERLEYASMVERLYDYRWMALAPRPGEGIVSEDFTAMPGKKLRIEIPGPATVARLWFSSASGRVDFFLDGAEAPTFSWDLGDCASGQGPAYLPVPIAMPLGSSWESHLPMPFRGSMVMEYLPHVDTPVRIQLDLRSFGEGVSYDSLSPALLAETQEKIQEVADILREGTHPASMSQKPPVLAGSARYVERTPETEYGKGDFIWTLRGRGVVRWMDLVFIHKVAPAEAEEMLRSLRLRIETRITSKEEPGQVLFEVPLGDFFGSAPGANPLYSYPMGFDGRTGRFHFRLPIPFEEGMRIAISSDLQEAARMTMRFGLDVYAEEGEFPPMRLHSGFARAIEKGVSKATELRIDGPAHLVGYHLTTATASLSPMTHAGTFAFADYVGSSAAPGFSHVPLREGPMGFGRTSLARIFGLEAPSDAEGLSFSPGLTFPEDAPTDVSATVWFYAPEGTGYSMDSRYPKEQRMAAPRPEAPFLEAKDAMEGERATGVLMSPGTTAQVRAVPDPSVRWSQLQFLEWQASQPEDTLTFPFALGVSGKYRLLAQFAHGESFGSFQVLVDGKPVGEVVDCSGEGIAPGGEIQLAELRMMARADHAVSLRSLDGKAIGVDYLRFEKVVPKSDQR